MNLERIVYTCITAAYESPKPIAPSRNVQAVLFTDTPGAEAPGWEVRPLAWTDDADPVRVARWHKHHPHKLFPRANVSLWIDGTHTPIVDVNTIFATLGKNDMALFKHPWWNTVAREATEILRWKLDDPEAVARTMQSLLRSGFRDNRGLWCSSVLVRRHTPALIAAQKRWWSYICRGSRRDQLAFPQVLRETGLTVSNLPGACRGKVRAGVKHRPSPFFDVVLHNSRTFRKT